MLLLLRRVVMAAGTGTGHRDRTVLTALKHMQFDTPSEAAGDLLGDHLNALVEEADDGTTWQKGHSPRFEGFSWDDAR